MSNRRLAPRISPSCSRNAPGPYLLGTGPAAPDAMLHGARYDFNDEMLPVGATYWARLVESELAA